MVSVRRIASAVAVALAAAGVVTFVPAPAAADTVTVRWGCGTPLGGGFWRDFTITITAPATATVGQTATVRASIAETTGSTWTVPAGKYTAQLEITLGGAISGYAYANGLSNPEIPQGTPWRVDGGEAQVTFGSAGTVTYSPRRFLLLSGGIYSCGGQSPVAATTRVS